MAENLHGNPAGHFRKTDDPLADLAAITGYRDTDVDDLALDFERELAGAFADDLPLTDEAAFDLDAELAAALDAEDAAFEAVNDDAAARWDEPAAPVFVEPAERLRVATGAAFEADATEAEIDLDFGYLDFGLPDAEVAVAGAEAPVSAFEDELAAFLGTEVAVDDTIAVDDLAYGEPDDLGEMPVAAFETVETMAAVEPEPIVEPAGQAPAPADPFAELAALAASYRAARTQFSRAPSWAQRRAEPVADPEPVAELAEEPALAHAPEEQPRWEAVDAEDVYAAEFADDQAPAIIDEDRAFEAADQAHFDAEAEPYAPADEAHAGMFEAYDTVAAYGDEVPLTDELDLPDLDRDVAPIAADDAGIDVDFIEALGAEARNWHDQAQAEPEIVAGVPDDFDADFERELAAATSDLDFAPIAAAPAVQPREPRPAAAPEMAAPRRVAMPAPSKRGVVVAAGVLGVALLGGIAAFAFMGDGTPAKPVIVKADKTPVKVKPENPGGAQIANQDKAVYERVAGEKSVEPQQKTLVDATEEPVRLSDAVPAAPQGKAEDRIDPQTAAAEPAQQEFIGVAPKKVRTLIVKPDGSMEAAPVAVAESAPTVVPEAKPAAAEGVVYAPPAAADEPTVASLAAEEDAPAEPVVKAPEKPKAAKAKPAKEPSAEQVAAVAPQATAATGEWTIQIASQPSSEAAQATYKALASKYGSIIGGRGVSIVQAEIAGKGTFYRVRIPAGSKSEANALCSRYQAAGGSCFISR